MESGNDVFSDWAVVDVNQRIYVGKLSKGPDDTGFYILREAFELVVVRLNGQTPEGRIMMMQENMHTTLPLCAEGEVIEVKPSAIRRFSTMTDTSRREHVNFVESAQRAFAEARLKKANIQPASAADLANIGRRA